MHISQSARSCAIRMIPCTIAMAGVTGLAVAGVGDGTFHNGGGSINFNPATQTWHIQATNGSIIHYNNFDIPSGYTAAFQLGDPSARVLNRVFSNDPTLIDGTLTADGIVYLTNPAGIVFGNGSVIDTAGFYAAAAQLQDGDFLAGNDLFLTPAGNVVNMGLIRAENAIHLIGRHIENRGTIDVTGMGGVVTLSATDHSVHIGGPGSKYLVTITNNPPNLSSGGIGINHTQNGIIQTADDGIVRLGAGDIFSLAIQLAGSGIDATNIHFASPVGIDDHAVIHGNTVFDSTVNSSRFGVIAPGQPARLEVHGNADFNDAVGVTRILRSIDVFGNTFFDAGLVLTNNYQDYRGSMTIGSDTKLQSNLAGNVSISGPINGPHALLVQTDGTIFIVNAVGNVTPLDRFVLVGNGKAVLHGKTIDTVNQQFYFTKLDLADNTVMFSELGEIRLMRAVDGKGFDLTLDAVDSYIRGEISGVRLLTSRGSGATHIEKNVTTTAGMRFENAVNLTDSVTLHNTGKGDIAFLKTIDGAHNLLVITNDGDMRFGQNVGGTTPLASLETIANGTIFFGANLVHTVGDILLNDQVNLIAVPAIATLGAEGDITFISASGDFVMGHKQKLTALGNIVVDAANGSATLGDMHALGDMTVNANAILLLTRDASNVMLPDGTFVMDDGMDFVAKGQFNFNVIPVLIGDGPQPRFFSELENADLAGTLGDFTHTQIADGMTADQFIILPETYLDPYFIITTPPNGDDPGPGPGPGPDPGNGGPSDPTAPNEVNLATAFAALDDDDRAEFEDTLNIDAADRRALLIMGVIVRDSSNVRETHYADGRAIYDDMHVMTMTGNNLDQPVVSINRVHRPMLHQAIRAFDGTLMSVEFDVEAGRLLSVEARDEAIGEAIAASWLAYRANRPHASMADFDRLAADSSGPVARIFESLANLSHELVAMGLTAHEAEQAAAAVLARLIAPINEAMDSEQITVEDLSSAIEARRRAAVEAENDGGRITPADRAALAALGVALREIQHDDESGLVDGRTMFDEMRGLGVGGRSIDLPVIATERINPSMLLRTLRHLDGTLLTIMLDAETGELAGAEQRDAKIADAINRRMREFRARESEGDLRTFARSIREDDMELTRVFIAILELPGELTAMGLTEVEAEQAQMAVIARIAGLVNGLNVMELDEVMRHTARLQH